MNYVFIKDDQLSDFSSVLPEGLSLDGHQICLCAYDDEGVVSGAIVLGKGEAQYDLNWIFVPEPGRRKGIATGLLREAERFIGEFGLMPLSAVYEVSEEDEAASAFFQNCRLFGMAPEIAFSHERFYVKARDFYTSSHLNLEKLPKNPPDYFIRLPVREQRLILNQISSHLEVPKLELYKEICVPELCLSVVKNDRLQALSLVHKQSDGRLALTFLYGINVKALARVLATLAYTLQKRYPDGELLIDTVTRSSLPLAGKLFPDARRVLVNEATWGI